jgi:DHA3 family tetracycline resistance protein-like MFS transporter
MLEPLRIRDFALLWTGMTTSLVGDFVFLVAYAWQTYELSNDPAALGWISAAYFAPTVIFLTAGGVLTDRMERRHMMIAADSLRAVAIGIGGALALTNQLDLWELGVVVALAGFGQALFAPAFGSIVPEIVPRELLAQANSLDQLVRTAAGLVGPAVGGVVVAAAGAGTALLLDAGTFAVSTVTALLLTPRPFERPAQRSAIRDVREGWGFVRTRTWLWATFIAGALMNVASAARNVLLPFVIKNDLHASASALGFVYAAASGGALISAFAYGQRGLPRRPIVVAYLGWAVSLLAIAGYGLGTSVLELVCFGFVGGLGISFGQAIWGTLMHRLVPRALLGRVTSIDWMTSLSLMPVAAAGAGLVAAEIGARETLAAAGLLAGGATVLFLLVFPNLRRPLLEPAGEPAEA